MVFRKSSFGGMGEAILHKVGMHGFGHGVFADNAFERQQDRSGLAVGNAAVRVRST